MSRTPWVWPDAMLLSVEDGDTVEMRVTKRDSVDIGFGGQVNVEVPFNVRLRLNRINAPARSTTSGKASSAFLSGVLTVGASYNIETVKAYKFGGPEDSPGEWMVEVTLGDGTNVSDLMVSSGFAVYWDGQGPRPSDG